jgi:hypothetical protein
VTQYVKSIILETVVVGTHLAQAIDSPSITAENLITNKVTAISAVTPGTSISYTMNAPPTAVSRIINHPTPVFLVQTCVAIFFCNYFFNTSLGIIHIFLHPVNYLLPTTEDSRPDRTNRATHILGDLLIGESFNIPH